jgi:hypothetical protein
LPHADAIVAKETEASRELTPEIREALRSEAFRALKSLPRRGAEIGGFLTRSAKAVDNLSADGVDFVPSEHLYGPSYRLSPSDVALFRQTVEHVCGSGERIPQAFFRSCTREHLRVDPEDIAALSEVLPGVNFILLVRPFQNGNAMARVFAAGEDEFLSEFELQLNFTRTPEPIELESASEPPLSEAPVPVLAAAESTPLVYSHKTPPEDAPSRNNLALLGYRALAVVITIIAAVALFYWARNHSREQTRSPLQSRATPPSSDLGMRVEAQKNSFRVTWNRNLPALQNRAGILRIEDGRQSRELQLDQSQIASGSLVYVSDSTDLTFRMEIRGEQGHLLAEHVRVVVGKQSAAAEPSEAKEVAKTVVPPAGESRPQPEEIRLPAAKGNLVKPVVRAWPSAAKRTAAYRPAYPLRRITPEIQSSLIHKPLIVKVQVLIDSQGHVSDAREIEADPALVPNVSAQAVNASRQWTFQPAQSRGKNVPSDYKIVYWFTPAGS